MNPISRLQKFSIGLAAMLLVACNSEEPNVTGTGSTTESGVVVGQIFSHADGKPVSGARVALYPVDHVPAAILRKSSATVEGITDENGWYRFKNVPAGHYNVAASKDSLKSYQDSLEILESGTDAGIDTLKETGSLAGHIEMQSGDDARTVLILVLGTNSLFVPQDASGHFTLRGLAGGKYRVRFLSTLSDYSPLDTMVEIRQGKSDSLENPIRLNYTGTPAVQGLKAEWDGDLQRVLLSWHPTDTAQIAGYYVYRAAGNGSIGSIPLNADPIPDTSFSDTTAKVDSQYVYAVKAVDKNGNPSLMLSSVASVATPANYTFSRKIVPEGWSHGLTTLSVNAGKIYWMQDQQVAVYDTSGVLVSTFGSDHPGELNQPMLLKVIHDTVYVLDNPEGMTRHDNKFGDIVIKKYSPQGTFMDSLSIKGIFQSLFRSNGDFWITEDGVLFAGSDDMLYVRHPDGNIDSVQSTVRPPFFNITLAWAPDEDRLLVISGIFIYTLGTGGTGDTRIAVIEKDLSLARLDSATYKLNAATVDDTGRIWVVRDDARIQTLTNNREVIRNISLPKAEYRDIVIDEEDNIYLYNSTPNAILIYRKREK